MNRVGTFATITQAITGEHIRYGDTLPDVGLDRNAGPTPRCQAALQRQNGWAFLAGHRGNQRQVPAQAGAGWRTGGVRLPQLEVQMAAGYGKRTSIRGSP